MALMGPSGSGKTTLLNSLAQRQTGPVGGRVLINGKQQSLSTHRLMSDMTSWLAVESRPLVGSSRYNMLGSVINCAATLTRRF
jgi:ABC-type Fe3+/spermidine/putrescine transport system ATPase subunit